MAEAWLAWYEARTGRKVDLPSPSLKRRPFDEDAFEAAWSRAVADVRDTLKGVGFVLNDIVYHPQLRALEAIVRNAWDDLEEPDVYGEALVILRKLFDQPIAALVGFEQLEAALSLGGDRKRCQDVADLHQQYMNENPLYAELLERIRRGSYPIERPLPPDFIPEDD